MGKAELDLSLYGDDDFNILKLKLENCEFEDAFIEVGLKATPVVKAPTPAPMLSESKSASIISNSADS